MRSLCENLVPVTISSCRRLTPWVLCALAATPVRAQSPADSVRGDAANSLARHTRAVTVSGLAVGGLTLALFDNHLAYEARKFHAWSGPRMQHASLMTSSIGGYLPLVLGGALATTGWAVRHDFTRKLGTDVVGAVITSGVVTLALKGSIGRARPRMSPDDADMYYPGRGFFDNSLASFPSGHTSAAFASATVLATELSRAHPAHSRWIKFGMYGAATAVGLSRMTENAHWASDVFAGATLGTLSGMRVVRRRDARR